MTAQQEEHIAYTFSTRHFVILDNVVDLAVAKDARAEIARADDEGGLEMSTVYAGPQASAVSVAVPERRAH